MRALVTGAAGFIGSNLVDRLLADGHQVVGVDDFSTGVLANLALALDGGAQRSQFTLVEADIRAPELVDIVARANPHAIFHLAAQGDTDVTVSEPQLDASSNVLGTLNVCEASRQSGVRRIVYAMSAESPRGASAVDPVSPHAVSKLAGALYLRAYAEMYGLMPICLSLTNIYGPRQISHGTGGVISALASALITGQPYVVYRDGGDGHDYVYVDDAVEAFVRAGCAPLDMTGTYDVCTGQRTTATRVRELIAAALDQTSVTTAVPESSHEPNRFSLKVTEAENAFGWKPTVDIAEGIQRTVRWLSATLEPHPASLIEASSESLFRAGRMPRSVDVAV